MIILMQHTAHLIPDQVLNSYGLPTFKVTSTNIPYFVFND